MGATGQRRGWAARQLPAEAACVTETPESNSDRRIPPNSVILPQ